MTKAHFLAETRLLRDVARQPYAAFVFWDHAEEEMKKDGISRVDIRNVAQAGSVVDIELVRGRWRLRVTGWDGDGGFITFIAVVNEKASRIDVITAWKQCGRR